MFKRRAYSIIAIVLTICLTFMVPVYAAPRNSNHSNKNHTTWFDKKGMFVINKGIFKGDGQGNYYWNDNVKRGDVTLIIVRAFNLNASKGEGFQDVSIDSYYYNAITIARALGIARGDGFRFSPERHVTIEEAIALIERAVSIAGTKTKYDLEDLFSDGDMSRYATREDIANMLYYILTGNADKEDEKDELDNINYTTSKNTAVKFDSDDFRNVFDDSSEKSLSYVKFVLPSSTKGKLYYNYVSSSNYTSPVSESTKYFSDSAAGQYLDKVSFIPYTNFTGTVTITYTAYDGYGSSYEGTVKINVGSSSDTIDNTVKYTTSKNSEVTFEEEDFSDALQKAADRDLSYVKFTLPSSIKGKLYYNYSSSSDYGSAVSSDTKYYTDSDDGADISRVSFVPYTNYTGTVTIAYTAYDDSGKSYSGSVLITVKEYNDNIIDNIVYTTDMNHNVTFDTDDFCNAYKDATGDELSYVKFYISSYLYGIFYYDYNSSSDKGTVITADNKYYVNSSDGLDISKITFVPYANFTGSVYLRYMASNGHGGNYQGKIKVTVGDFDGHQMKDITYKINKNSSVTLNVNDFEDVFDDAFDKELSYIKFNLSSYLYGNLFYEYKSSSEYSSVVKSDTKYYTNSADGNTISKITFVPYSNYTGIMSIGYTAYDGNGHSAEGVINVEIAD